MTELTEAQWTTIQEALAAPFAPESISFRVQGKNTPNARAQVLAYLDARDIQDRLDAVVGAGNWHFDWQPVVTDAKGLQVVKGTITIYGVSKSDVGDASTFEGNKGCISDAEKRAAVQWGIGRYLYGMPAMSVTLDERGNIGRAALQQLRATLSGKPMPTEAQLQRPPERPAQPQRPALQSVPKEPAPDAGEPMANEQQLQSLRKLATALGKEQELPAELTFHQAGELIRLYSKQYNSRPKGA